MAESFTYHIAISIVPHRECQTSTGVGALNAKFDSRDVVAAAAAGFVGSIVTGGIEYHTRGLQNYHRIPAMIAGGAISSGVASEMMGGDFMDGFYDGLFVAGFNHAMHLVVEGVSPDDPPGGKGTIKKASSLSPEENMEVAGKVAATGGLWATIESERQYSELFKKWMDKNGKIHDFSFHGNQYTGGMKQYALKASTKFTRFGQVFGGFGLAASIFQLSNATTIDEQLGYGIDAFFGGGAIVAPGLFTIPSTIWFFGGKQATYWYNSTTITPMIENGINPGLMINQPFK